ncbi:uncharacterized protein ACA1_068790 [Acanthamoeba castellanii str. Neff]|uniref:Uncharacterized protein n=1 Tax=Acanthamoeba castellanii (strain ATCC 30010 / Neff) TaxID=1257118 RepID=L8HDM6_ACACF|nr:uncharacterized protein ACA1_068790 [Acanthamoeba castellanii str. Neff]ELR23295.1 hypothetical protein ACA1_068790 [Acanthamoeba castellanii str. Neff]
MENAPSMLDLMAQFETSTTLRDSSEARPVWRAPWEDQDSAFQTEFDSELSFLCDRIHVKEDDPMSVGHLPYIL